MKANELIEIVNMIEIPVLNQVGYVQLENSRLKNIFGLDRECSKDYIFNFQTGKLEIYENGHNCDGRTEVELFNSFVGDTTHKQYFTWFNYLSVYNATFVGLYSFYTGKIKGEGDVRNFVLEDYYFITEDKYIIFRYDGNWTLSNEKDVIREDLPFSFAINNINHSLVSVMLKQFGVYRTATNYSFVKSSTSLTDYLFRDYTSEIGEEKLTKKMQKFTNDILSIPLDPIEYNGKPRSKTMKVAMLEHIKDDVSVIRWFIFDSKSKHSYEYMRYYVTDEINFLCDVRSDGQFHVITKNILKDEMITEDFVMDKTKLAKSVFRYFFDMIDSFSTSNRAYNLYETFRFELLERFAKTGLKDVVNRSLKNYMSSRKLPYTTIGEIFSVKINPKETDIHRALGLNKYQYKKLVDLIAGSKPRWRGYDETNLIIMLRTFLKGDAMAAINDVDNTTFDTIYEYIAAIYKECYHHNDGRYIIDSFSSSYNFYSMDARISLLKVLKILTASHNSRSRNAMIMIYDYIMMVRKMDDSKHFPLKFSDITSVEKVIEESQNMHDAAMAIYNLRAEKLQKEGFEKAVKKCKKWEYNNGSFSVISPVEPCDLAREGLELHHCVKGYVDRVVAGKTNIMFIRNTDDLDKPFFTVEISNNGTIEQVHGFGNRNSDTEPGLDDFLAEWMKAKKIKKNNIDKIR